MWQTFLIWRLMNSPLPIFNPFRKLLKLNLSHLPQIKSPSILTRILSWFPSQFLGCLVGLGVVILTVWASLLCIVFVTPIVFVFFDLLPSLIFLGCAIFGIYLSVKITRSLGRIRSAGIYDLIGVTSYGDQRSMWLIGRTIYRDMEWLRDTRIMMSNSVVILMVFLGLMTMLGLISAFTTPTVSEINFFFLQTLSGLGFFTIAVYLSFVQAMVVGYLIALWSITLTTDNLNRVIACVGVFIGVQLAIYLVSFLILILGIQTLYTQMKWDIFFTQGFLQLTGFALIHEIAIRILLRRLAHQAELPYRMWRAEVGL